MAGEECILAGQGDRADQVLDAVGVDLDPAIVQEGLQPVPVTMDIGQFLPEAGLHRYAPALQLQPVAKGGDQRRTARLASRQSLAGAHATDLSLDPVKLSDPAQALGRDLGAVALEDLLQLAPCMRPAMGDDDRRAACPGRARRRL